MPTTPQHDPGLGIRAKLGRMRPTARLLVPLPLVAALAFGLAGCGPAPGTGQDPHMIAIPAGSFDMGCAPQDPDCLAFERPADPSTRWCA